MTVIPDNTARLTESTRLLVLDPTVGPVERPLAAIALGDEVLAVSSGRMCFRRLMASNEASSPSRIATIAADALGAATPRHSIMLDARQMIAPAALPTLFAMASVYGTEGQHEPGTYWLDITVEGADSIIAEHMAVATGLRSELPEPAPLAERPATPAAAQNQQPASPTQSTLANPEPSPRPTSAPPPIATIAFKPVAAVPDQPLPPANKPAVVAESTPRPIAPSQPEIAPTPKPSSEPAAPEGRQLAIRAFNGPIEVALLGVLSEGPIDIYRFNLPPRTTTLRLSSPSAAPEGDGRRLGIAICRIVVETTDIPLESPALVRGFHRAESGEGLTWRWTDGEALLLLPPRPASQTLSVHITNWHVMLHQSPVGQGAGSA